MKGLSSRLSKIQPSATLKVAERAAELSRQGRTIISFSVGEPDFPTPPRIVSAAKEALDKGATRYTQVRGIPELLGAIADESFARRKVQHQTSGVVVSVGAKHTLYHLMEALINPGDEVIIPAPYWVSYPEQVLLMGGTPVLLSTSRDSGFKCTPEQLKSALSPITKAVIFCSPSNPTGAVITEQEWIAIADVLRAHDCYIIVDEIYADLIYDQQTNVSLLTVAPDLLPRMIIVDGVSKSFAMTGWRIGWMLGPDDVAKAVNTLQGQATTNPAAVSQHAALAALKLKPILAREDMLVMRTQFEKRRNLLFEKLSKLPGVIADKPQGAFYILADFSEVIAKNPQFADDTALATYFLEEASVAVVPGTPFGASGHVRFSYACSEASIETGLSNLKQALASLKS